MKSFTRLHRKAALHGALALLACAGPAQAQLFTPGNLVVSTYGSATATLADGAPTAINLVEYAPGGGAALLTLTLPTTDGVGGSGNFGVVGEYGSSSEGYLQLSGNGAYLTLAGYQASAAANGIQPATNHANGTSYPTATAYSTATVPLAQSTDGDVPRVAVLVDAGGKVNASTLVNDLFNTNNPRAVYSANGASLYLSGQGDGDSSDQGIFLAATGLDTIRTTIEPTGIYNAHDTRFVTVSHGNLYYSTDKGGSPTGVYQITGLPTGPATPTLLTAADNGRSGSAKVNYSPAGFYFADATTLYVADTGVPKAGGTGDGGIQKWTFNGSAWTLLYTLTNPNFIAPDAASKAKSGETGFEALAGRVVAGNVELYAVSYTAGDDNPNGLYTISDPLGNTSLAAGEAFTELEASAGSGGSVFKGVALTPGSDPAFFAGQVVLGSGVYYLAFPNGNDFGYYSFLDDPTYIYHSDLGYEYVFDAQDDDAGVYFYDFKSSDFFYTSPTFPFPCLYDFGLGSVLYYYPDPNNAGHYNTDGVRYFYDFNTGTIIIK